MASSRLEQSMKAERDRLEAKLQIAQFRVLEIENSIERLDVAIAALKGAK